MWIQSEFNMDLRFGINIVSICFRHGINMDTVSIQYGFNIDFIRFQYGFKGFVFVVVAVCWLFVFFVRVC